MMLQEYHAPFHFRFYLNAFIQALRNVTFMLQSEERKPTALKNRKKFDANNHDWQSLTFSLDVATYGR